MAEDMGMYLQAEQQFEQAIRHSHWLLRPFLDFHDFHDFHEDKDKDKDNDNDISAIGTGTGTGSEQGSITVDRQNSALSSDSHSVNTNTNTNTHANGNSHNNGNGSNGGILASSTSKQEIVSSPYITAIQVKLGKMYVYLNKFTQCRTIILNAGETALKQFGYNHSLSAQVYYIMGLVSNAQGQFRDSMDCYIKARLIYCSLHKNNKNKEDQDQDQDQDQDKQANKNKLKKQASNPGRRALETQESGLNGWPDMVPIRDLDEFLQQMERMGMDLSKKNSDIYIPEFCSILDATCFNMTVHGPGYLEEAWGLCNRSHDIKHTLFAKESCFNEKSGSFDFKENTNYLSTNRERPDVLPMAHAQFLKAQLYLMSMDESSQCQGEAHLQSSMKIIRTELGGEENVFYATMLGAHGSYLLRCAAMNTGLLGSTGGVEVMAGAGLEDITQRSETFRIVDETLSRALVLRRKHFGDRHAIVAESMQQIAFLLLARAQLREALALMKDGALPLCEVSLGNSHPFTLLVGGCAGLCLKAHAEDSRSNSSSSPSGELSSSEVQEVGVYTQQLNSGRELVVAALDFFRNYPQGALVKTHPWVLLLGGYEALCALPLDENGKEIEPEDNDFESEQIAMEVDMIPKKSSTGLLYSPLTSELKAILPKWKAAAANFDLGGGSISINGGGRGVGGVGGSSASASASGSASSVIVVNSQGHEVAAPERFA